MPPPFGLLALGPVFWTFLQAVLLPGFGAEGLSQLCVDPLVLLFPVPVDVDAFPLPFPLPVAPALALALPDADTPAPVPLPALALALPEAETPTPLPLLFPLPFPAAEATPPADRARQAVMMTTPSLCSTFYPFH